jgi:hypothetical protein
MTVINQTTMNNPWGVNDTYRIRFGERFTSFPHASITSIQLKIYKSGSPTGTAYLRIRKVSDDSILGTLGSVDVATLGTSPGGYVTFNTTPVVNDAVQDIRILLEYTGATGSNYVGVWGQISDVYAGGILTDYLSSYSDQSTYELAWNALTYTELGLPTVTTQATSDITQTTATGNGNITDTGGENPSVRGICYSSVNNPPTTADDKKEESGSFGTGAFTESLTSLSADTTYYARAYATNSSGTSYGSVDTFHTERANGTTSRATSSNSGSTWTPQTGNLNFQNFSTDTLDVPVFPNPPAIGDGLYIGKVSGTFTDVLLWINQAGVGSWTIQPAYYNGSTWVNLTLNTNPGDTTQSWKRSGVVWLRWTAPGDWATIDIAGITAYYIKIGVSAYASITTQPIVGRVWII